MDFSPETMAARKHLEVDKQTEDLRREERQRMPKCPLSGQQLKALSLTADGLTQKEIALELGISWTTVRGYVNDATHRLDAKTTLHAILHCVRNAWISPVGYVAPDVPEVMALACERLDELTDLIESRHEIPPNLREYLKALDAHLAARSTDPFELNDTRTRMVDMLRLHVLPELN